VKHDGECNKRRDDRDGLVIGVGARMMNTSGRDTGVVLKDNVKSRG